MIEIVLSRKVKNYDIRKIAVCKESSQGEGEHN